MKRLAAALAGFALALSAAGPLRADDDHHHDHDRARDAVRDGRALPLATIAGQAEARTGGTVLDVEFEDEKGRFIYEVKVLAPGGRIMKLEYDAVTGTLLRERGRR